MSQRTLSTLPWQGHGALIGLGAVLLSILAHLALAWWTSGLLWHPKVIWVQTHLPLTLAPVPVQASAPPRVTRQPRVAPLNPPPAPEPSVQAPDEVEQAPGPPAPEDVPAPIDPSPPATDLSASSEEVAPTPLATVDPVPADAGPLEMQGQPTRLPEGAQTLHYKVFGAVNDLTYRASSKLSYEPQPDSRYSLQYQVGAFLLGQRKQVSQGQWGAMGLEPREFTDQSRRTQITRVDTETQTVKLPANPEDQPWKPGMQDRLSVFVQLGSWVAAMPTSFETGRSFRVPVWSSRETETWLVVSQGTERLETPYGDQEAIRLARMPLGPTDARVDMWFVPAWGALPVRIEMVEANGNRAEQNLSEIEPAVPVKSP